MGAIIAQESSMFYILRLEVCGLTFPVNNILAHNTLSILAFVLFRFWHPLYQFITEPEAFTFYVVKLIAHVANAVFKAISPRAPIGFGTVLPDIDALSVSLVVLKLATVLSGAIEPLEHALSILLIVDPLSFVDDPGGPLVEAHTADLILVELSFVDSSIWEDQFTVPIFLASRKLSNVARLVSEDLVALAMGASKLPLAFIDCAIGLLHGSLPMHLIFEPASFVHVHITLHICALARLHAVHPVAVVVGPIRLLAEAQTLGTLGIELANKDCTGLYGYSC